MPNKLSGADGNVDGGGIIFDAAPSPGGFGKAGGTPAFGGGANKLADNGGGVGEFPGSVNGGGSLGLTGGGPKGEPKGGIPGNTGFSPLPCNGKGGRGFGISGFVLGAAVGAAGGGANNGAIGGLADGFPPCGGGAPIGAVPGKGGKGTAA